MFKDNQTTTPDSKTVIGASVTVEGDFKGQGDVLIEGTLHGSLTTDHDATIGPKAHVEANVQAKDVHVSGQIKGNITAAGHVELAQSARVDGDITAKTISIEAGAQLQGMCSTKGAGIAEAKSQTPSDNPQSE